MKCKEGAKNRGGAGLFTFLVSFQFFFTSTSIYWVWVEHLSKTKLVNTNAITMSFSMPALSPRPTICRVCTQNIICMLRAPPTLDWWVMPLKSPSLLQPAMTGLGIVRPLTPYFLIMGFVGSLGLAIPMY